MNLTLESDYAIRIVLYIAEEYKQNENNRIDANTISLKTDVTLRFSLKILRKLVAGGILASYKGLKGGYTLSKEPKDITLKDIVEIVEGQYAFSRCLLPDKGCCRSDIKKNHLYCKVRRVFSDITDLVRDKLTDITIESLINE